MVWTETIYYCSYCNCNISNMKPETRIKHEEKCKKELYKERGV
jgi:hypothetical protein